jgi:hypothetical protein
MIDDLTRTYRRWLAAEDTERDDDADAACRALFVAVEPEQRVAPDFTARTMKAFAAATERDARRARQTRAALAASGVAGAVTALYFGGGLAVSLLSAAFLGLLNLVIGAVVGVASGAQTGADFWGVLGGIGRAISAFVSNPTVTVAMVALQGIAIGALFALQRLLESDRESFK